jgi:hypothetical protein
LEDARRAIPKKKLRKLGLTSRIYKVQYDWPDALRVETSQGSEGGNSRLLLRCTYHVVLEETEDDVRMAATSSAAPVKLSLPLVSDVTSNEWPNP